MGDLGEEQSSDTLKLIGSNQDGSETNFAGVSSTQEVYIRDTHDNGGLDTILTLDDVTPVEGMVSTAKKANRKYVIMEALSTGVKWGFSNSTQSFDLFKSQLIMVPIGENTEIWFIMSSGTGSVAFGELS